MKMKDFNISMTQYNRGDIITGTIVMIGEKEVSVSVGNFGSTSYNQTNISQLEKYISALKTQINKVEGRASRRVIKVVF